MVGGVDGGAGRLAKGMYRNRVVVHARIPIIALQANKVTPESFHARGVLVSDLQTQGLEPRLQTSHSKRIATSCRRHSNWSPIDAV